MQYVRGRRLTEAARVLVNGAPDILAVALDSGYGSHEAFTRAFREEFGLTPEAVRERGDLNAISITEPIRMKEEMLTALQAPRFAGGETLLVAGLSERYTAEGCAAIPSQWQKFVPHIGHVPGQFGKEAYGVICNSDDTGSIDYITGVAVSDFSRLPPGFARLRIPPQRYAVFHHPGHISGIQRTWYTIWNQWMPESGFQATGGPEFERYGEEFNGVTGLGGVEIWIPVKRQAAD